MKERTDFPILKRQRAKGKTSHGRASEKNTSKRLKAYLTPASGAIQGAKGDMVKGEFLLENKSTIKQSLSLKYEWLEKISREAVCQEKTPSVSIQFVDSQGASKPTGRWVLIPEHVFQEFIEGE